MNHATACAHCHKTGPTPGCVLCAARTTPTKDVAVRCNARGEGDCEFADRDYLTLDGDQGREGDCVFCGTVRPWSRSEVVRLLVITSPIVLGVLIGALS